MKENTTSLGNCSEGMRQLQSSSGLTQDGGLNAKSSPPQETAASFVLGFRGQQAFVKSLSQLS